MKDLTANDLETVQGGRSCFGEYNLSLSTVLATQKPDGASSKWDEHRKEELDRIEKEYQLCTR